MSKRVPASKQIATICLLLWLIVSVLLFCVPATVASAGENRGVGVKVSIGSCIRVSSDGTVRSNVSTVSWEGNNLFTVVAL
jgi:hypothetical protein